MKKPSSVKINGAERIYSQALFLDALAGFLVDNSAGKSIALQMEEQARPLIQWAFEWKQVRSLSTIRGWADREEAIKSLCTLFGIRAGRVFEILNETNKHLSRPPYQIKNNKHQGS